MDKIDWSEAPDWADRAVEWMRDTVFFSDGVYFLNLRGDKVLHGGVINYDDRGEVSDWWCELGDTKLIETRPDQWQEGEERMNNIAQNGNDGHYGDALTLNIEPIDINISETARLQGEACDHSVLNDPIISAIIGKTSTTDVIEHGNNNGYSTKIKTIVIDGIDHDIYVDVYDVLTAFNVINHAAAHAVKKQLKSGKRGVKGVLQDLTEARDSLNRAIEIEQGK